MTTDDIPVEASSVHPDVSLLWKHVRKLQSELDHVKQSHHGLYQVTPHQRYATEHVHSFARYTLPLNVTRTLGRWGIPLDGKFACCFVSHQRSQSQRVQFGKMLITA